MRLVEPERLAPGDQTVGGYDGNKDINRELSG